MKLYCRYFKDRIIDHYNRNKSIQDIISLFRISRKTLYNWRKLDESNKLHQKTERKKYESIKYTDNVCDYIRKYIVNNYRLRMKNLLKLLKRRFNGQQFNANNVYYALKKSGITYKKAHKVVIIKKNEHKKKVKEFKKKINKIGLDKVLSTDECHFHLNMTPDFGWIWLFKNNQIH